MTQVNDVPWMPEEAVSFLCEIVHEMQGAIEDDSLLKVLEFGSGGSTVWLDNAGCRVVSVEHSKAWFDRVSNHTSWHTFHVFHQRPYVGFCDLFANESFDIVLVDGRDRVRCVQNSMRLVRPNGWLILDDANRPRYAPALESLGENGWKKVVRFSNDNTLKMVQNAPNKTRTTCFFRKPEHT